MVEKNIILIIGILSLVKITADVNIEIRLKLIKNFLFIIESIKLKKKNFKI